MSEKAEESYINRIISFLGLNPDIKKRRIHYYDFMQMVHARQGRNPLCNIYIFLSISQFTENDLYEEPTRCIILCTKIRFIVLLSTVPSFRFACTKQKKFLLFLKRNKRIDFFYFMTHLTKIAISGTVI